MTDDSATPPSGRNDPHARCSCRCAFARRLRHTPAGSYTFHGLVDGARAPGARASGRAAAADRRRWSGCTASASPATCSAASAATAGRSCARRSSGSPTPAATCSTCGRRAAASACTTSSTPTRCRTRAWTPTRPTWRSATARTSATTPSPPRCCGRSGSARVALLSNNPDKRAAAAGQRHRDRRAGPHGFPPVRRERLLPVHEGPPGRSLPARHRPAAERRLTPRRMVRRRGGPGSPRTTRSTLRRDRPRHRGWPGRRAAVADRARPWPARWCWSRPG